MPSFLNKITQEYEAIFGKENFTPISPIETSQDFQCGAMANELEYARGFCDYVIRTGIIDNLYGSYLEKVVDFFTGLKRIPLESDESLRNRFKVLCIRQFNPSWITSWMIKDVFSYFFDQDIIYLIENMISDEFITDGGFENNDPLWISSSSGSSVFSRNSSDHFVGNYCGEFSIDSSGSNCSLSQTLASSIPAGYYQFSFFVSYDGNLTLQEEMAKVSIIRSSDGYYYNFSDWSWQAAPTYWVVDRPTEINAYQLKQAYVNLISPDNLTIKIENYGSSTEAHKFWIDRIQFGTQLEYPSVKVLLINEGPQSDFLSVFPGTGDPVPGVDYDFGSYLGQAYLQGIGGAGTSVYYQNLLNIIKPVGVYATIEIADKIII